MSSADWEEVKRLASDFQRAQLTVASQRLTESNCIEIVNKLLELKLIEVVFTTDGKEYVTPQQIIREIQDEVYLHAGRISLVELSQTLCVSHEAIEGRVNDLVRQDRLNYHRILGQIVTAKYLDGLCEDLNERLSQEGVVNLSELSKLVDLPGDFLQTQIEKRIGRVIINCIQDEADPSILYTDAFVRRATCKLRGIFSAITKPTPLTQIIRQNNDGDGNMIPEKLFFSIINKLLATKRLDGIVSGTSGRGSNGYYNPSSFNKAQNQWIDGFMHGNGYIDLDAAGRLLGMSDPKSFVLKRFSSEKLYFLKSYCLGESLFGQVKDLIEESLKSPGWVDVNTLLPMSISSHDVKILLYEHLEGFLEKNAKVFGGCLVVSLKLIKYLKSSLFKPLMEERSKKDIESGRYVSMLNEIRNAEKKAMLAELSKETDSRSNKKDERRKKAVSGKQGGGTQGRETKTKATKNKYMAGKKGGKGGKGDNNSSESSDDDVKVTTTTHHSNPNTNKGGGKTSAKLSLSTLEFLSLPEISQYIKKSTKEASKSTTKMAEDSIEENFSSLTEAPEELIDQLARFLANPLQEDYQRILKEAYDVFMREQYEKTLAEQKKLKLEQEAAGIQLEDPKNPEKIDEIDEKSDNSSL